MHNVVIVQDMTFAIFEPFFGGLVAPDVGFPCFEGYVLKVLGIVDIYVAFIFLPSIYPFYFGNSVSSCAIGKEVMRVCSWGLSKRCSSRRYLPMVA